MAHVSRNTLYLWATVGLCALAIGCIVRRDSASLAAVLAVLAALWVRPPSTSGTAAMALLVLLPACTTHTDWHPFGFRSSSIEMTTQVSNPTPSGVGGLYTKTADGLPRLVSTTSVEYPAGEARHIYTYAGAPPGAVTDDCWMDSTDANRLWCMEDVGAIRQRFDGTAPGALGCGGTPAAGCFTSVTIGGALAEAVFSRTCTITSAAAATPVTCLADADVPAGKSVYLLGWHAKVNGATAWSTTATCTIQDSGSTGFAQIAVAALTGNAFVGDLTANVTVLSAYSLNLGGMAAKGLRVVCNANGTGSDLVVTLYGSIK